MPFVLIAMNIEKLLPSVPRDTAIFVCGVYAAGGQRPGH